MFYLETNSQDPCFNLAFEEYVFENKTEGDWLLLWQNSNTIVVGLNQNTAQEINAEFVRKYGTTVVRRMTGGGAVYHDLGNLNYSFITDLLQSGEESIGRFAAPVCAALASLGIHAEFTGRNDITIEKHKISGAAQRINGHRILHHGTLLFDSDLEKVAGALQVSPEKFQSKGIKSVRSRVGNIRDFLPQDMELGSFWDEIKKQLSEDGVTNVLLDPQELEEVSRIAEEKYRSWEWTWGKSPVYDIHNRKRWSGGTLEVSVNVKRGIITAIAFIGDFMAVVGCKEAQKALIGVPFNEDAVLRAFEKLPVAQMFGSITNEEIMRTLFD